MARQAKWRQRAAQAITKPISPTQSGSHTGRPGCALSPSSCPEGMCLDGAAAARGRELCRRPLTDPGFKLESSVQSQTVGDEACHPKSSISALTRPGPGRPWASPPLVFLVFCLTVPFLHRDHELARCFVAGIPRVVPLSWPRSDKLTVYAVLRLHIRER